MTSHRLGEETWVDLVRQSPGVLAIPLGATEQHGPHLPLSTDTEVAVAIAEGLARARRAVIVAPAIPYGSSGEHDGFAGTLSIGRQALELVLTELVRSASASIPRIVLINAHGGNAVPVAHTVTRLRSEGHDVRAFSPAWEGDAHAGYIETSLALALCPDRVRLDRAQPGNTRPLEELMPQMMRAGLRRVSPNGVLGDPAGASAHTGRVLLRQAVCALTDFVDAWCADDAANVTKSLRRRRSPTL